MKKSYITLSFLIFIACFMVSLLIKLHNQTIDPSFPSTARHSFTQPESLSSHSHTNFILLDRNLSSSESLKFDYYRDSCPNAENIIRATLIELYHSQPEIAPAIIRLLFHDCFPQGCDASVLLDRINGLETEKKALPNQSLKHLEAIDLIKSKLEDTCPGVVSCADIIVLAARESVVQAGGPFYPLYTGRRDSPDASFDKANELPKPDDTHSQALRSFASRGFDAKETVALLGAHSTGKIHCEFLRHRLNDFLGSGTSNPAVNPAFLQTMRATCNAAKSGTDSSFKPPPQTSSASRSLLEAPSKEEDPFMKMDYEGPRIGFGTLYYQSLMQGRGILFVDQQLMADEETASWVRTYASDVAMFRRDFGLAMTKLSNLQVLTAPRGQVRLNCRKVN